MSSAIRYESAGLPKSVVGWVINHSTRNFWRVADWYEIDDLIQDGLMVAYKCQERYPDVDPPHFMALVKRSFYRHITYLLRNSRGEQAVTDRIGDVAGELGESSFLDRHAAPAEGDFDLLAVIADMPPALKRAVAVMVSSKRKRIHLDGDDDETLSSWLKKVANFPTRFDFETELRAYLWESKNA